MRSTLLGKYPTLPDPPSLDHVNSVLGPVASDSHHSVDHQLLAALLADAVDVLITEDVGIHRKAKRLLLQHRVAYSGRGKRYARRVVRHAAAPAAGSGCD